MKKNILLENNILCTINNSPYNDRFKNVHYKVDNDTITLSGSLQTLSDEVKLLKIIKSNKDIKHIHNNININTLIKNYDDASLTNKIKKVYNDSDIDNKDINITIRNGRLYLNGSVNNDYELEIAKEICLDIDGINEIYNNLKIH